MTEDEKNKWATEPRDDTWKTYKYHIEAYTISPDGKHSAFIARDNSTGIFYLVKDNNPSQAWEYVDKQIVFSPNSNDIAYLATKNDKWYYIVNSKVSDPYDFIQTLAFTENGDLHILAKIKDDSWAYIKDGKQVMIYNYLDSPKYYEKTRKIIYRAREIINGREVWFVVKDGENLKKWDYVDNIRIFNDKSIVYRARDIQGRWYYVKDEKVTYVPDNDSGPLLSPDGKIFLFFNFSIVGEGNYFYRISDNTLVLTESNELYFADNSSNWHAINLKGYDNPAILVINGIPALNIIFPGRIGYGDDLYYQEPIKAGYKKLLDDGYEYYLNSFFRKDGNLSVYTANRDGEVYRTIYDLSGLPK